MVGSGYVGLVSGACFADFGHQMVCIDKDQSKIDLLHAGVMSIYEPGLDALVESNAKAGRLSFTTDLAEGIVDASAIFIAEPFALADGETLFVQHDLARGAYFIGWGALTVSARRPGDGNRAIAVVGAREVVGELCLIEVERIGAPCVSRLDPGIPTRGCRDRRFQAPRPHRDWRRGRIRLRDLPPAVPKRIADPVHRLADPAS